MREADTLRQWIWNAHTILQRWAALIADVAGRRASISH
jgi:hypothetical protein